jgi:hypothetical protein
MAQKHPALPNGIPRGDTVLRVLGRTDRLKFEKCFLSLAGPGSKKATQKIDQKQKAVYNEAVSKLQSLEQLPRI